MTPATEGKGIFLMKKRLTPTFKNTAGLRKQLLKTAAKHNLAVVTPLASPPALPTVPQNPYTVYVPPSKPVNLNTPAYLRRKWKTALQTQGLVFGLAGVVSAVGQVVHYGWRRRDQLEDGLLTQDQLDAVDPNWVIEWGRPRPAHMTRDTQYQPWIFSRVESFNQIHLLNPGGGANHNWVTLDEDANAQAMNEEYHNQLDPGIQPADNVMFTQSANAGQGAAGHERYIWTHQRIEYLGSNSNPSSPPVPSQVKWLGNPVPYPIAPPLETPLPGALPGTWTYEYPSPQYQTQPQPEHWPAHVPISQVVIHPNGLVEMVPGSPPTSPPPAGTKETKAFTSTAAYGWLQFAMYASGEALEWIELLGETSDFVFEWPGGPSYEVQVLEFIFLEGGWKTINWEEFIAGALLMAIENGIIGAIVGGAVASGPKLGLEVSPSTYLAL